ERPHQALAAPAAVRAAVLPRQRGRGRLDVDGRRGARPPRRELAAGARVLRCAPRPPRPPQRLALDQRRADGGVLPVRRAGDQTRAAGRPALHLAPPRSARHRGSRRHGGAGADLRGVQLERPGHPARLGDPVGHRHRLRARRPVLARAAGAGLAQGVPRRAGHHRRPRRGGDHRRFLRGRPVPPRPRPRRRGAGRAGGAEPVRRRAAGAVPAARRAPLAVRAALGRARHHRGRRARPHRPAPRRAGPAGRRGGLAPAPAGAPPAPLGRVRDRPGVRLRQRRRVLRGRFRRRPAGPPHPRRRARAARRQAGGRVRRRGPRHPRGLGRRAHGRGPAAARRRVAALRHRLHHEPVHRPARLRRRPGAPGQGEDRHPRRLRLGGAARLGGVARGAAGRAGAGRGGAAAL
ncbi:MAG: Na+/H+ antiporter NhaA type, partial [uncultured Acetobacteraceae bacterium]